jgi:hypothetical protein
LDNWGKGCRVYSVKTIRGELVPHLGALIPDKYGQTPAKHHPCCYLPWSAPTICQATGIGFPGGAIDMERWAYLGTLRAKLHRLSKRLLCRRF